MTETVRLTTPDYVELEYQLAGLGTRFGAVLFDHLLQTVVSFVVAMIMAFGGLALGESGANLSLALLSLLMFIIWFGYFVLMEWLWNGQTLGKKICGLRVIREDGRPINFAGAAIRNIVRLLDFMPAMYGFGILTIFFNRHLKRLGDLAAGTIVVVERPIHIGQAAPTPPPRLVADPAAGLFSRVGRPEREAALRFLSRRHELDHETRTKIGSQLAKALAAKAEIDENEAMRNPEAFLEALARSE